jgi:hypothetical protein
MSKTSSKKPTQVVYAMALYSGVIKSGYCYVQVTTSHPETEFEKLRPYYGKDVKGRWVKSIKSQESLEEALKEKLSEHEYSDFFYKLSTTEVVKVLKEVFSCNKCTTMGIYDKEEDDEEAASAAPAAPAATKGVEKKVAAKAEPKAESKEDPKSKSKSEAKKEPKVEDKSTKPKASKKEKQVVSEDEEDTKKKVVKSKSTTKTQIVLSDSEEELEEEE